MSKTRYYSVLIPLLLLFTYSINYGQLNPDSRKLIEDRLNNPSFTSILYAVNPPVSDIDKKDYSPPLIPAQYLLRSGSCPYGDSHSVSVDSINNIIYLGSGEGGYEIWNVEDSSNPFLYTRNEIYYYDIETPVGHVQVTVDKDDFAQIASMDSNRKYMLFK